MRFNHARKNQNHGAMRNPGNSDHSAGTWSKVPEWARQNPGMKRAIELARYANLTQEEQDIMTSQQMWKRDQHNMRVHALEEGLEKGLKQGLQKGRVEGIESVARQLLITLPVRDREVIVDQWQLEKLALVGVQFEVLFYVPGLPADFHASFGANLFASAEAAVAALNARLSRQAHVAVIPEGPYVLARVQEGVLLS